MYVIIFESKFNSMATASKITPIEKDDDLYEIVKRVVDKMYLNGSDNRSSKCGHPETLITSVIKNTNTRPVCVGIWEMLPQEIRKMISEKSQIDKLTYAQQKTVVDIMLKYYNTYSSTHVCYMNREVHSALSDFSKGYIDDKNKHLKNSLLFRSIHVDQERQKRQI